MRKKIPYLAVVCSTCVLTSFVTGADASAQSIGLLPSPWVSLDVGAIAVAGAAAFDQGQFRIAGSGADIGGTSDQFQFVYQQVTGDVDLVARVDTFVAANNDSKVGIMARASLAPTSAHGFAFVSGAGRVGFARRRTTSATTALTNGTTGTVPRWLRLVRVGSSVTTYSSADGTAWQTIAGDTIALGSALYVGLAITSRSTGLAQASLSNVTVTSLALPAGQAAIDIGSPAVAGSSIYRNGVYTIAGAGADIGGASDQFRFVYQRMTGDGDVTARIGSLERVRAWTKAGVMIRESLDPAARHAMALISGGKGYSFQWRLDPGGAADFTSGGSGAAPGWVRLVRKGYTFEAFRSKDGIAWTSMGRETIPMSDTVYVGLAVTSHVGGRTATATFDHYSVEQPDAPANQPPIVTLRSPTAGASFTAPATIALAADATDPENRLARVEFYANGTRIGSATAAPFAFDWTGVAAGTYSLVAVAADQEGATATSPAVTIDVTAGNRPPTVTLTSPVSGATFTAPATIGIVASAADPEGRLQKVEFYIGGALVAADPAAPFSASWSATTAGSYAVKAVAYDADGLSASSTATVTIVAGPRWVVFGASPDHATLVNSYRLDVFANGAIPGAAPPLASVSLGKPAPDPSTNDIRVDAATFFVSLVPGTYSATVSAVGAGGESRSTAVTFVR